MILAYQKRAIIVYIEPIELHEPRAQDIVQGDFVFYVTIFDDDVSLRIANKIKVLIDIECSQVLGACLAFGQRRDQCTRR